MPGSEVMQATPDIKIYVPPVEGYFEKATALFNYTILDPREVVLGPVRELILDLSGGHVAYIVFSVNVGGGEANFPPQYWRAKMKCRADTFSGTTSHR
jgi:hypothetical protein